MPPPPPAGPLLSISYTLRPPQFTPTPPNLSSSPTHEFPLQQLSSHSPPPPPPPPPGPSDESQTESQNTHTSKSESESESKAAAAAAASRQSQPYHRYYAALRDAIAEAKIVTGRELTEWRDAVGGGEKEKVGVEEDEEDEGEEGEEGEGEEEEEVETKER